MGDESLQASRPAQAPGMQSHMGPDSGNNSSQSQPQSISNSQTSHVTSSTDQVVTPPASDKSGGVDNSMALDMLKDRYSMLRQPEAASGSSSQDSQLHQLSAIAAAQDRLAPDTIGSSRKRMADGDLKDSGGSMSPVKGHGRSTSAVSVASTTGSTIGELSAELRTRLSYAMVKVNHGWQSRSLEEVESLAASMATSPSSSTATVHRRNASSASPRQHLSVPSSQARLTSEAPILQRRSDSPPVAGSNKPMLAPPVHIRPSSSMPAPRSNPRRNTNPHYTPTMLSHSHSATPNLSTDSTPASNGFPRSRSNVDHIIYSPHKNVREQDAIESLLFMSSPGNSTNLKHSFSPSHSPGPQPLAPPRSVGDRHALPSGPRRGLPGNRPSIQGKKVGFDRPSGLPPPDSPMDVDSPQQQYHTPNRSTLKRQAGSGHHRSALSLPTGLGLGNGTTRKVLRDEDIERMLDRAGAELADSSDDEEIQLPS